MCGILGIFAIDDPLVRARLPEALDTIAHRGPDGEGRWDGEGIALLHRRLAIIDTGTGGHQPMVASDTGNVLCYNGEIYNYREVRDTLQAQGVRLTSHSDSEVLLKAIDHWGTAALPQLNGMWAFAHWDHRNRRLLLCRDRFGVKPLYYAMTAGGVAFASEPKALIALDPSLAEIDQDALNRFMVSSISFDGENCFFKRIKCLPPAHYIELTPGQREIRPVRYWNYPEPDAAGARMNEVDAQESFEALFDSSVRLRMRSDVPIGITLSGGLDSTAILSRVAPAATGKFNSFCATFGDNPGERYWALMATDAANTSLDQVAADGGDWLDIVRKITWHMDAPSSFVPTYALWKIAEHARNANVKVLLEGQGADELFAGYVPHGARMIWDKINSGRLIAGASQAIGLRHAFGITQLMRWMVRTPVNQAYTHWQGRYGRGKLLKTRGQAETSGTRILPTPRNIFELLRQDHSHAVLPALLHYGDAVTMAHGVESRLPFMDYRIVEWVFRNRPELSVGGYTKLPVRRMLDGGGYTPLAKRRDKKGFTIPTAQWVERFKPDIESQLLENHHSKVWNYVSRRETVATFQSAKDDWSASHLYKLITLNYFLHNYDGYT